MSKRLQVVMPDEEYDAVADLARREGKPVARVVRDPEIAHDAFAGLPVDAIGLDHAHRGAGTVGGAIDFYAHGGILSHLAPKVKYDYLLGTT